MASIIWPGEPAKRRWRSNYLQILGVSKFVRFAMLLANVKEGPSRVLTVILKLH